MVFNIVLANIIYFPCNIITIHNHNVPIFDQESNNIVETIIIIQIN